MVDTNNKKEKLFLEEGIIDPLKEVLGKIESKEPLYGQIMMGVVKDLVFGEIQKKDMPVLLQQRLNISQADAQNLSNDIETKILPFVKKIPDDESEEETTVAKEEYPLSFVKSKPTISVEENEKFLQKERESIPNEKFKEIEKIKTPTKRGKVLPPIEESEEVKPAPKPRPRSGPDSYREPIE